MKLTSSSAAGQSSFTSDIDYLHDLFPQVPHSRLSQVCRRFTIADAIEHLLVWNDTYCEGVSTSQTSVIDLTSSSYSVSPSSTYTASYTSCSLSDEPPRSNCEGLSLEQVSAIPTIAADPNASSQDSIKQHAQRVIDSNSDTTIELDHSNIWRKAKGFYKTCLHDSYRLRKKPLHRI